MRIKSFTQSYPHLSEVDLVGSNFAPNVTQRLRPVTDWSVQGVRFMGCWKTVSE